MSQQSAPIEDIFGKQSFGKAALKKLGPVPENFRLYSAGWLGKSPENWVEMRVTGCEMRHAKKGVNAGKLCIPIPGTKRSVVVTKAEILEFKPDGS